MERPRSVYKAIYLVINAGICVGLTWKNSECAQDNQNFVPEGMIKDNSRFNWLGIIQHAFYMAEGTHYAVSIGMLIHPGYVLASAQDISRIIPEHIGNKTQFIVYVNDEVKYALDVTDYALHPEFEQKIKVTSIALLQLRAWKWGRSPAPVLPVCLPTKGTGVFEDLRVIRFTDETKHMEKTAHEMLYVDDADCHEFYERAHLNYDKMVPSYSICAVSKIYKGTCIWDAGNALIMRRHYSFWVLTGFGPRGPGCGAPSRYISLHPYLSWIDQIINPPYDTYGDYVIPNEEGVFLRSVSPYKIVMVKASIHKPQMVGQCKPSQRGDVIYKDYTEVRSLGLYSMGYYFAEVHDIVQMTCGIISFNTDSRSRAAIWVEHNCHPDEQGFVPNSPPGHEPKKFDCFVYFRSTTYVEFRYNFIGFASVTMILYGQRTNTPKAYIDPWPSTYTTDPWVYTDRIMRPRNFRPFYKPDKTGHPDEKLWGAQLYFERPAKSSNKSI